MILSIKSWRRKKKLHKPIIKIYWPELQARRFYVCIFMSIKLLKIEDLVRTILYIMLIIEKNFQVSLYCEIKGKGTCFTCWGKWENWTFSCWEKGNFIMINEFKYGQTWKICPSPLSLSLYSTFKEYALKSKQIFISRADSFSIQNWQNWGKWPFGNLCMGISVLASASDSAFEYN